MAPGAHVTEGRPPTLCTDTTYSLGGSTSDRISIVTIYVDSRVQVTAMDSIQWPDSLLVNVFFSN